MTPRRFNFLSALYLAVSLSMAFVIGCTRPVPSPDAPTHSVSSPADTAETVANYADWALPAAKAVTQLLPIPSEAKASIVLAIDAVRERLMPRIRSAIRVYRERGGSGGDCELHRATGAFVEGLLGVGETIGAAGFQIPAEVVQLIQSCGGILDEFAPRCEADAGFQSAGSVNLRRAADVADTARRRGVTLRPFPPLPRE